MKTIYIIILLIISTICVTGQTDTEFWFVAPEAIQSHGDRPVYLRMATLTQASTVTISQPANPAFPTLIYAIPANSSQTVDLTSWIDIIENKPADVVLNYGFHIVATEEITAYYEIYTSCFCNPDIFSLKGENALGLEFYTPFQNFTNNGSGGAYSSFDIVATQNNTQITITPANDITGHVAGVSYTITLNAGQTYSATATSQLAASHLGGSHVVANKPIAITVKDDSLAGSFWGGCADITGDQIVPIDIVGKKYIIMRGFLNNNIDKVFVLAIQDNTSIYIDGSGIPVATINTGQTHQMNITAARTYLETNKPVYVLHMSGFGCELGCPLLPPIECTGSQQVSFVRSTDEFFGINIMCKSGDQGSFIMNGSSTLVPASAFAAVPGTLGVWVSAQISFTTAQVPAGSGSLITNADGLFHVGIINGGASTGARYGYFSDYGSLNLGPDLDLCYGNTLSIDASLASGPYVWNTGDTSAIISIDTSGIYSVLANQGTGCSLQDTVVVSIIGATPQANLGPDLTVCANTELYLQVPENPFFTYQWHGMINNIQPVNGTGPEFYVDKPGTYSVTVDGGECGSESDTIHITYNELGLELGVNQNNICNTNQVVLNATTPLAGYPGVSYLWSTGATSATITALNSGTYSVTVSRGDCSESDEISINYVSPLSINLGTDTAICINSQIVLNAGSYPYATYHWSSGGILSTLTVSNPGTYSVTVTNGCGSFNDSRVISIQPPPTINLGPDFTICQGTPTLLQANSPGSSYLWSTGQNVAAILLNQGGNYSVTVSNACGTASDLIHIQSDQPLNINLGPDTTVCPGFILNAGVIAENYYWSNGAIGPAITINESDIFMLEAVNECGTYSDFTSINVLNFNIELGPDKVLCPGESANLNPGNVENGSYSWSTGQLVQGIQVSAPGTYIVTVTNICETKSDTIHVSVFQTELNLGNDTTLCPESLLNLDAGHPGSIFIWSTGENTQTIQAENQGIYWVSLNHSCGSLTDSIQVSYFASNPVNLGSDTIFITTGNPVVLDAGSSFLTYLWSTGAQTQSITALNEGLYQVEVIDENGCHSIDSVMLVVKNGYFDPQTGIRLFPNPANEQIQIASSGKKLQKVEIFNTSGQILKTLETNSQNISIDVIRYPAGIYWFKISLQNDEILLQPVTILHN